MIKVTCACRLFIVCIVCDSIVRFPFGRAVHRMAEILMCVHCSNTCAFIHTIMTVHIFRFHPGFTVAISGTIPNTELRISPLKSVWIVVRHP